jgi:hypothetical protein
MCALHGRFGPSALRIFLSRWDFDFGIAAGRGCLNSIYDVLDMETKLRPLLLPQYHDCDLPTGKILLGSVCSCLW